MKKILFALIAPVVAVSALASEPEYIEIRNTPGFEMAVAGGTALQSGYLTRKDSAFTYGVDLNVLAPKGMFSFSWQGFTVDHDTSEFPLANNKAVTVRAYSFLPYVKVYENKTFSAYAGLGFTQVNLYQDSPEYDVTYGTMMVSGLLRYELNHKWSLHYKTNWYDVNQTANGVKTSLEVWSHLAGVGYRIY